VNFALILMIGKKMGFSEKEVGRMTPRKWSACWEAYKLLWNNEALMLHQGQGYQLKQEREKELTIGEVIPF